MIPEGYGAGIVMLWDQRHVDAGVGRRRRGAQEGRPEVHARRLQAERLVGAGAHRRPLGLTRGGGDRSWLLIKHRDDWAGDLDITEFAPRSVKSDGDFEDILAADKPDVWLSNRPAKGGEAGEMLEAIIERAAALKAGRAAPAARPASPKADGQGACDEAAAPKTTAKKRRRRPPRRAPGKAVVRDTGEEASETAASRRGPTDPC